MDFLKGYKTFIISTLVILGAAVILILDSVTFASVPEFVWSILGGLGLITIRDAINTISVNDNQGWKTRVAAVAFVVLGVIQGLGIAIPAEVVDAIIAGLSAMGVIGVRDALNKVEPGSLKV